jgi:hypothetical protein
MFDVLAPPQLNVVRNTEYCRPILSGSMMMVSIVSIRTQPTVLSPTPDMKALLNEHHLTWATYADRVHTVNKHSPRQSGHWTVDSGTDGPWKPDPAKPGRSPCSSLDV